MSTGIGGILAKGRVVALAAVATVAITGVAEACPNYGSSPSFGTIPLYNGFLPDPYVRNITAGGGYNLISCGFNWQGWVASRPDFRVQYTAGSYPLSFIVNSQIDTVLLINGPDGQWYFNDDNGGDLGAGITFNNPTSGQYDIWIGSYYQASGIRGQLVITEQQ